MGKKIKLWGESSPFKMWESWIGVIIGLVVHTFVFHSGNFLDLFKFGFHIVKGILFTVGGFLLGWGIHSLIKKYNWKIVLGILIGIIVFLLIGSQSFLGFFVTAPVFLEEEPLVFQSCQELNGICLPVQQPCSQNRVEYGACSETMKCCIIDYCLSSGGRYTFNQKIEENRIIFEKICICKIGERYDILIGCTKFK